MQLTQSIIPKQYKEKDPRTLLYYYPDMPIVRYAKLMQQYSFYQALEVAENVAQKQGFILIPYNCMHWERRKRFRDSRKVKVGRNSFFMMKQEELTKTEKTKFTVYLEELQYEEEMTG